MEYSVGSLADLITGSNTPNKPKVIQKEFKKQRTTVHTDPIASESKKPLQKNPKSHVIEKSNKSKRKHINKLKRLNNKGTVEMDKPKEDKFGKVKDNSDIKKPKKARKRKLDTSMDNISIENNEQSPIKKVKLSKNEENAEKRILNKEKKKEKIVERPEVLQRTLFVGNIPLGIDKKKIKQHFRKYGNIESIRIRGIPVADIKVSKKVAAIKKEFNPKRNNVYCFIRFMDKEDAIKAQVENGKLFEERHLRVHICGSNEKPDETKAIFVGNLSFDAEEDELWKLFETCGPISYVRIVRDSFTGMGKGFGYVNFKDSDAVQLALEMENIKLKDRELRISLCNLNVARKNKNNKKKKIVQPGKPKPRKNFGKKDKKVKPETTTETQEEKKVHNAGFQGTKFSEKKKKRKANKGLLEKKKMIKKLAPKPKAKE